MISAANAVVLAVSLASLFGIVFFYLRLSAQVKYFPQCGTFFSVRSTGDEVAQDSEYCAHFQSLVEIRLPVQATLVKAVDEGLDL